VFVVWFWWFFLLCFGFCGWFWLLGCCGWLLVGCCCCVGGVCCVAGGLVGGLGLWFGFGWGCLCGVVVFLLGVGLVGLVLGVVGWLVVWLGGLGALFVEPVVRLQGAEQILAC
ncbi:hypothetical protein, partial [Pseudomonas syringae group genomosp. 7]|uniref:hypothetical protein n=1 Tax=Pseudomonas syringae group genomosp. 7 TaxID=251699 RepID=UPI0037701AF3